MPELDRVHVFAAYRHQTFGRRQTGAILIFARELRLLSFDAMTREAAYGAAENRRSDRS